MKNLFASPSNFFVLHIIGPERVIDSGSRSDSDFESSNVSLKENKPGGVNPNSNDINYYVRKSEEKNRWFSAGWSEESMIFWHLASVASCTAIPGISKQKTEQTLSAEGVNIKLSFNFPLIFWAQVIIQSSYSAKTWRHVNQALDFDDLPTQK